MPTMTKSVWSDTDRDKVYTELCEAVTRVGQDKESLYLSRVCLLLVEAVASRETALRILADAENGLMNDASSGGITYRI
jgi:hypothetical protein